LKKSKETSKSIDKLLDVMTHLRSKQGCPWDVKQTFSSLKPYIIEEAFEVVEAIDEHPDNLKEEMGDLLLQVVFLAQIAKELNLFNFEDVAEGIANKLIRRHPHVFENANAETAEQVITNWNKIKKEQENKKHLLDGIPSAMPALLYSQRLSSRASSIGFDWDDASGALSKVKEETKELIEAIEKNDKENIEEEIGDLLFSLVNVSRKLDVNSEQALKKSAKKFKSRFDKMEELNHSIIDGEMSINELEELWQAAKKAISAK